MSPLEIQLSTILARAVAHETERGVTLRKAGFDHEFPNWISEASVLLAKCKAKRKRKVKSDSA